MAFPPDVGPDSLPRDNTNNWLCTRFSRSFDTLQRYGWLRMVSTRCVSSERQFGTLREKVARERQVALSESCDRTVCYLSTRANKERRQGKLLGVFFSDARALGEGMRVRAPASRAAQNFRPQLTSILREANINWSMVICQGSTRSKLP